MRIKRLLLGGSLDDFEMTDSEKEDNSNKDQEESMNADIVAYALMLLGWFIIIRSITNYIRARKMEKIIAAEPSPDSIV